MLHELLEYKHTFLFFFFFYFDCSLTKHSSIYTQTRAETFLLRNLYNIIFVVHFFLLFVFNTPYLFKNARRVTRPARLGPWSTVTGFEYLPKDFVSSKKKKKCTWPKTTKYGQLFNCTEIRPYGHEFFRNIFLIFITRSI